MELFCLKPIGLKLHCVLQNYVFNAENIGKGSFFLSTMKYHAKWQFRILVFWNSMHISSLQCLLSQLPTSWITWLEYLSSYVFEPRGIILISCWNQIIVIFGIARMRWPSRNKMTLLNNETQNSHHWVFS